MSGCLRRGSFVFLVLCWVCCLVHATTLFVQFHKAQRAKEKREQEEMLDQLDDSLDVVRALLGDTRKSRGKPNKDEARKSYKDMLASGQVDEAKDAAVEAQDDADEEGFSYDRAVRCRAESWCCVVSACCRAVRTSAHLTCHVSIRFVKYHRKRAQLAQQTV